jgi:hypothetical protein
MKIEVNLIRCNFQVVIFVLTLFSFSSVEAQDFKRQYKNAKDLFIQEKYAAAMDAFRPLMTYDKENPYPEYATFFYALSSQKLGYSLLAKQSFIQLEKLYPNWNNIDEARYQLTCIYFKLGDYFLGLKELNSIKASATKLEAIMVKQYYLSSVNDIETLKLLLEEFPTDAEVAHQLAFSISNQGFEKEYKPLFDSLVQTFRFNRSDFAAYQPSTSVRKTSYRVSLLFPFLSSSLDPSPVKKKNQFVIDLYQGMKLAVDSLSKRGISIELLAYDTERSLDTLKKILKLEELKSSDLLVGPLFTEEFKLANEFSLAQKIAIINPVTNNGDFVANNKYAFLFQPSYSTLGASAAEYSSRSVAKKTCLVFYGDSQKDSIMANGFIKAAKGAGVKVISSEMITKDDAAKIQTTLATPVAFDKWQNPTEFKIKRNSIGCVYVASDNPLIFSKVVNNVEVRNDSTVVIGSEAWLKDNSVDYTIYERLGVVLASPSFASASNPAYQNFKTKFVEKHSNFPSYLDNYAKTGYEFLMYFGLTLDLYGVNFLDRIKSSDFSPGFVSEGFNFKNSNDNKVVPFIRFKEGELVVAH